MADDFEAVVQRKAEAHLAACAEAMDVDENGLIDCPDCGGAGTITFNPSHYNDPQQAQDAPCPRCKGDGSLKAESPAYAPYCGCDTCIVREVLAVTWDELLAEARKEAAAS